MTETCAICGDEQNSTSLKLLCDHKFHQECLNISVLVSHTRECPYCRKRFYRSVESMKKKCDLKNRPRCCQILKTGKNAGKQCSNLVSQLGKKYCGIHMKMKKKQSIDIQENKL